MACYGWFWDFVTPRRNWSLQFLNCGPWVLVCLPHLNVHGDIMHLRALPGKFATLPDVWNFLIIALTVVSGVFYCSCTCLYPLPDLCRSTSSVSFDLTVIWLSPWWWMMKGFYMRVSSFLYCNETGSDGRPQYTVK